MEGLLLLAISLEDILSSQAPHCLPRLKNQLRSGVAQRYVQHPVFWQGTEQDPTPDASLMFFDTLTQLAPFEARRDVQE